MMNRILFPAILLVSSLPLAAQPAVVNECATLRHHGDAGAAACYQKLARSGDPAVRAEGQWGLKDYNGANDTFQTAVKARPKDPTLLVRWGLMYLEHWQPGDAGDLFNEALKIDEKNAAAHLGLAKVMGQSFEGKAANEAEAALKSDPKLYEAHELLARMALEDNNPDKAVEEAKKALEISPEALDAMAILQTNEWMNDQASTEWLDKIFKINKSYGEAYETAGYFFVINRRYEEGIRYYRKALEIKPDLWSARSQLGVNLMRFGQQQEARALLDECYKNGYKDAETVNSLTLLDSYKNFETFKTPTTTLILQKKEAALLRPYFQAELDRAMKTYETKYKFKLKDPVQLEVYPDHEDFAVRTMGMPGLGALGVTFGQVVAMDSPSGRKPGQFHWASTMWHELSHVYVIAMTNHRVPRWFTEGLAVYEETAAAPDWGDRLDHEAIMAIKDKKLLPIAELDRGYIHPTYPSQVIVSYFQGGQVITFIAEKFGYQKVLDMIKAFGDKKTTVEVIEQELKMKPEDFDKQFFPWLEARTKTQVQGFEEWAKRVRGLSEMVKTKDWGAVIKEGTAIRDIYPDYVELGSVYEFLAQAYLATNDKPAAIRELEKYSSIGGRDPVTLKQLAGLESEAGKKKEAAAALERLNLIYLEDEGAHQKLGDLYIDLGNANLAAREFQAVLAGKPVDPAGAHFQLARALQMGKRTNEARDEVFAALEIAPNYKPAQKMLLELGEK